MWLNAGVGGRAGAGVGNEGDINAWETATKGKSYFKSKENYF